MKILERTIKPLIDKSLAANKVVLLLGPRRVGKTVFINQFLEDLNEPYLLLNGDDEQTIELLARKTKQNYARILGDVKILIIDEVQKIPEIGRILKLIVDEIEGIKIFVTGSSALDIGKMTGEPLTGRKKTYYMYPISEKEFDQVESVQGKKDNIKERLIYGNYPELIHLNDQKDKAEYLKEIVDSYLLKDILAYDRIKNSNKILKLLRLIAFQLGSEVSLQELGRQLAMSKNTVEKYLDLLTKVFIIHPLHGFSRNLRKEITKTSKWYFYDNGIRNLIIANLNPIELRNDMGALWENYAISERIKYQVYNRMIVNNYFWRTYDQQEIDWVEEREGNLFAYEFKWNPKRKAKVPATWGKTYPSATFEPIHIDNYLDWIS